MTYGVSIVTSLYRSAAHLNAFHQRMSAAAQSVTDSYEIVYVNDGSPDDSADLVRALAGSDPRVVLVDLSRNFGQPAAMFAGLACAKGERVFLIDADLEEEPELLQLFHRQMVEAAQPIDVVYGVMTARKGGWLERHAGTVYYRLLAGLSPVEVPPNQVWARLMTRRFVDAVLQFGEHQLYPAGVFQLAGFRQLPMPVVKTSKGYSAYTLTRRAAVAIETLTAFSIRPLMFVCLAGILVAGAGLLAALWLVWRRLSSDQFLVGWTSLIVSVWLVGGLMIFAIGLVGIYVGMIHLEVKRRPRAIVREVVRGT
jgi:putative glycosyltransferase